MTPFYEIKGEFDKKETSFGCGYKIVLELHFRIIITCSCRCGGDILLYILALSNTLTHIVTKVRIDSALNLTIVQAEKRL